MVQRSYTSAAVRSNGLPMSGLLDQMYLWTERLCEGRRADTDSTVNRRAWLEVRGSLRL